MSRTIGGSGGVGSNVANDATNAVGACALVFVAAALLLVMLEGWSLLDAVYFCTMTASTVGLGDLAPRSVLGRVVATTLAVLTPAVTVGIAARVAASEVELARSRVAALARAAQVGAGSDAPLARLLSVLPPPWRPSVRGFAVGSLNAVDSNEGVATVVLVAYLVVGGTLLTLVEAELAFGDALWLCVALFTTVGYGDVAPKTPTGRALASVLVLGAIGVHALVASAVTSRVFHLARPGAASSTLSSARDPSSLEVGDEKYA